MSPSLWERFHRFPLKVGLLLLRSPRWRASLGSLVRSAAFIAEELGGAKPYANREALLSAGVRLAPREGLFLEFGVFRAASLNHIAREMRRQGRPEVVYGFDSFQGLPEGWTPDFGVGAFAVGRLPSLESNAKVVPGLFSETLPVFLKEHPGPVAFLHLDADLYSSTKCVLDLLRTERRLVPGTVIGFDELFGHLEWWRGGEYQALREFESSWPGGLQYVGYVEVGGQAAVTLTAEPNSQSARLSPSA